MVSVTALKPRRIPYYLLLVLMGAVLGLVIGLSSYDWQGLFVVAGGVGVLAAFMIPRLARIEAGTFLLKVLVIGLMMRFIFIFVDYWVAYGIYGGFSDVATYYQNGVKISEYLRNLDFSQAAHYFQFGTGFIDFFTGLIFAITGPTIFGGYVIYMLLSFFGSYYFYKAFQFSFPKGNTRLYALLVFFFPAILFWANGIGKDSLIFFFIGLFAYGGARFTKKQTQGLLPLAFGFAGTLFIRPHIVALLSLTLALALLLPTSRRSSGRSLITFVIGLLFVAGIVWLLLPRVTAFVGMEEFSPEALLARVQQQQEFSAVGGSAFQAGNVYNPLSYPFTLITLLFRPFPWEANNTQALVQSLQGIILFGIVIWRIRSLGKAIISSFSNSYVRFVIFYIIGFVIIFSAVSNFGIIVRQSTMMLAFFFMLLAYSPSKKHGAKKVADLSTIHSYEGLSRCDVP
jgi:hypothetical protein